MPSEGGLRRLVFADAKFGYLFGEVDSNPHNAARTNQLALEFKRLGIFNDAPGRASLVDHFTADVNTEGNIVREWTNDHGQRMESRQSLLQGPSGSIIMLETSYEVLPNGERRFVTTIPKRGS